MRTVDAVNGAGKKVLVTGGTGFTGSFVVRELCEAGYEVCCFVRESSNTAVLDGYPVRFVHGDLNEPHTLRDALAGMDALVNVASIGFGHGPGIVRACQEAGVKRALFFSTTAVFTTLEAKTRKVRLEAEAAIKESGLDYTIFRPTMIFGTPRDRNMIRLIRFVDRFPVVPVFGSGTALQQPVYVKDLARAVRLVLGMPITWRQDYNLSGKKPLTYNQVIDTVAELLGRRVRRVHLPVRASLALVNLARVLPGLPNFSAEQVLRLNEDKAFTHQEATDDFAYAPVSFREAVAAEIKEYRTLNG